MNLKLTDDQISVILEALQNFNVDRITAWQLDNFDSGTDKDDYVIEIEETLTAMRGF